MFVDKHVLWKSENNYLGASCSNPLCSSCARNSTCQVWHLNTLPSEAFHWHQMIFYIIWGVWLWLDQSHFKLCVPTTNKQSMRSTDGHQMSWDDKYYPKILEISPLLITRLFRSTMRKVKRIMIKECTPLIHKYLPKFLDGKINTFVELTFIVNYRNKNVLYSLKYSCWNAQVF